MTTLLKARPLIDELSIGLQNDIEKLKLKGITPTLKVILVGSNQASVTYTNNKKKFCDSIGIDCEIVKLSEDIAEDKFVSILKQYAENDKIHGMLVQLPLPKHLQHVSINEYIPAHKDTDGFHYLNLFYLLEGDTGIKAQAPCTPKGIMTMLDYYKIPIEGKHVVVIGRSLIVGKPMSMLMLNRNATVSMCHSKTKNLESFTKNADIIVVAIGKAKFLTKEFINPEKKSVIIDVGMNYDENGKRCGDVDFEGIQDLVSAITPVPGGVGPLTIFSLAQNLIQSAQRTLL